MKQKGANCEIPGYLSQTHESWWMNDIILISYDFQWLILNERGQRPRTPSNIQLRCSWFMVSCLLKIGQQTTGFLARMNGFTILTRPGLKRTCPLRGIGSIFVFFMLHWMAYFGWNLLIPRGNEGLESRRGRWWCDHRKASRHRGKSLGIGTEVESWWPMVELVGVLITTRLHHVPWFIRDAHYE